MNGSLLSRHDDAGTAPEFRTERLGFGSVGSGFVLTPLAYRSDLAKSLFTIF